MFNIMGLFGGKIGDAAANQIVDIIDKVGWTGVAISTIMAIISAGGLSVASAALDSAIIGVKQYLKKAMRNEAVWL